MNSRFDMLAFDADDTLWHNERFYEQTQTWLAGLLEPYGITRPVLAEALYQAESRNIQVFGYGIKSFALSMIETAIGLSEGRLTGREVQAIIDLARQQLNAPVELFENVSETISSLAGRYRLMVITKGDLSDQKSKVSRSGLGEFFQAVEVVGKKDAHSYQAIFASHSLEPARVVMVGNSLRSDILPVLELGGYAVYIPHSLTWVHEAAEIPPEGTPRFTQLKNIGELPALLRQLEGPEI